MSNIKEENRDFVRMIHTAYHQQGGKFEVIIHKVSETNMTWRYSVRLWYVSPSTGLVEHWHLNGMLAQIFGTKLTKEGWLTGRGIGIERSFEVTYNIALMCNDYGYGNPSKNHDYRNGYQFDRYTLTA